MNVYDTKFYNDEKGVSSIVAALIVIVAVIIVVVAVALITGNFSPNQANTVNNSSAQTPLNRTIVDMDGRTVTIPYTINSIYYTHNPLGDALLMLAPNTLVKQGTPIKSDSKYVNLPVINATPVASGTTGDEQILAYNPDIVLYDYYQGGNSEDALNTKISRVSPIPVVAVKNVDDATAMSSEITFIGDLVGNPEKAGQLNAFYTKVLNYVNTTVATIPADQRKRVYYAEGTGLQTDGPWSYHSQLITIAGGINVADLEAPAGLNPGLANSMANVNMEQVLKWDPQVIICTSPIVYNTITDNGLYNNNSSNAWSNTIAYQAHAVYQAPTQPLNWIDRPPGTNRIIGIPWTAKAIYPEYFPDTHDNMSMTNLTKEFYSDFYNYNLNDTEVNTLVYSPKGGLQHP